MKYISLILFFMLSFIVHAKVERFLLIDFDKKNSGHPFDVVDDANKNKIGTFKAHSYYNFDLKKLNSSSWSRFDRIEFDIFNPNRVAVLIYFTLQDDKTEDYWTQLNHVQSLSPGWNRLSLDLHQLVGERGSVKVNRSIKLDHLKKMFIVVDPDKKYELSDTSFKIDNLFLVKEEKVERPKDLFAFDFSDTDKEISPFTNVTSKTKYDSNKGYGFTELNLYRNEDSKYASSILRSTMNVNKADFKIKLENGKYRFQLIIDQLGYWDVPFYKERMVFVNSRPIYKEMRNSAFDFLKDLLRFENVKVLEKSNPYELYQRDIFKKIESEFEVKNGEVLFSFVGDDTGVALNSLVIWKENNQIAANQFLNLMDKKFQDEFEINSRKINNPTIPSNVAPLSIVKANGDLNVMKPLEVLDSKIKLFSNYKEKDFVFLQLYSPDQKEIKIELSNIVDDKGNKLKNSELRIYKLENQFISPDLNHETYQVSARIAKKVDTKKVEINPSELNFFVIELYNNGDRGEYFSKIKFEVGKKIIELPIELKLTSLPLELPNFPVGFMALDPLPFTYFKGSDYEEYRKKYRYQALSNIAENGFTTFSGLPEVKVSVIGKRLNFDYKYLDEFLDLVAHFPQINTVFSYGGQFPNKLLNMDYLPYDMSQEDYHQQVSDSIKKYFDVKNKIKIVHTYSDEAAGYNDKIQKDLYLGNFFKKNYPFIKLGGFTQFGNKDLGKLNNLFDFGFYASLNFEQVNSLKYSNKSFGLYNSSQGALDDPRFTFGLGLYAARKVGMAYYLEWNSVGFNDYPYHDFDGRESDIVIFYPSIKGNINPSLRFLLSTEGLNIYRKLITLENMLIQKKVPHALISKVEAFLTKIRKSNYFFSDPKFLAIKNRPFYDLKSEINQIYYEISINK